MRMPLSSFLRFDFPIFSLWFFFFIADYWVSQLLLLLLWPCQNIQKGNHVTSKRVCWHETLEMITTFFLLLGSWLWNVRQTRIDIVAKTIIHSLRYLLSGYRQCYLWTEPKVRSSPSQYVTKRAATRNVKTLSHPPTIFHTWWYLNTLSHTHRLRHGKS